MNPYLILILAVLAGGYLVELTVNWLNIRCMQTDIPAEFRGFFDADKYRASQEYLLENTRLDILSNTVNTMITLAFIVAGGFNYVDNAARYFGFGTIPTGLIFAGIITLGSKLINLPFSIYDTFVLEEKYGFNKTTPATFIFDIIKALFLTVLIGGLLFSAILWLFEETGSMAWLYCWITVSAFQVLMIFIAPYVIMPLFNKFIPLEDGELKAAIETYARSQDFRMKGIFKMDGSKRSAKTNAFFTGFGSSRRIVLFDTLIAKHTVPELVAVVAHEMGHYRKKHILKSIIRSIALAGCTFYLMSLFIGNTRLFEAFKMESISIYASLFFFGFIYSPVALVIGIIENSISRKHEYEADAYTVETCGSGEAMVSALKKLSVDNLSNLTPHPFKIFLEYSHPPVLERIAAIRAAADNTAGAGSE